MPNNVTVRYGSKGAAKAGTDADRLRGKVERLQKTSAKGLAIGAGAAAGLAAFSLAGQAIRGVTGYLQDSADAFREDEVSIQKLNTALRANIEGWSGNTRAIDERIKAGQALGFSDEAQRSSIAELAAAYGDEAKALKTLSLAQDLARFSGVDLAAASDVLVKVHAGNFRALKALGINTKGITNETQALAAIQKVAAGQAEDYAQTLSGKLAVAEEKAAEASEKFGKSVARLQAVAIPLAADAIEGLANQFDALQNASDETIPPMQRADDLIQSIADSFISDMNPVMKDALKNWNDARDALLVFDSAAFRAEERVDLFADAAGDAAEETDSLAESLKGLTDEIDDLFDAAERPGRLQEITDRITALRVEIGKTTDAGDIKILTSDLIDLYQDGFELASKNGPKAAVQFLEDWRKATASTDTKTLNLIDSLLRLAKVAGGLQGVTFPAGASAGGRRGSPRASGGPVDAGGVYTVGERGPETLVMGGRGGTIIPNGGTGGGTTNLHFHFPNAFGMSPGQAQAFVAAVEPHITRAMQRRGIVGAARAF